MRSAFEWDRFIRFMDRCAAPPGAGPGCLRALGLAGLPACQGLLL
jgi:hypothetical protein